MLEAGHHFVGEQAEDLLALDEVLAGDLREQDDPVDSAHAGHTLYLFSYVVGGAGEGHQVYEAVGDQETVFRGGGGVLIGVVGGADLVDDGLVFRAPFHGEGVA